MKERKGNKGSHTRRIAQRVEYQNGAIDLILCREGRVVVEAVHNLGIDEAVGRAIAVLRLDAQVRG
jgi:hypothetical protein